MLCNKIMKIMNDHGKEDNDPKEGEILEIQVFIALFQFMKYEAVMGSTMFRRSNSLPSLKWPSIVENLSIVGK